MKFVSPREAVSVIKSNDRVFIQSVAASPRLLVEAMTARAAELRGVEVVHLHTEGDAPYARPEHRESFTTNCLFIGANVRAAVASGEADYIPVFLSEVPALFRRRILPPERRARAGLAARPPRLLHARRLGGRGARRRADGRLRRRGGQPAHATHARFRRGVYDGDCPP